MIESAQVYLPIYVRTLQVIANLSQTTWGEGVIRSVQGGLNRWG